MQDVTEQQMLQNIKAINDSFVNIRHHIIYNKCMIEALTALTKENIGKVRAIANHQYLLECKAVGLDPQIGKDEQPISI